MSETVIERAAGEPPGEDTTESDKTISPVDPDRNHGRLVVPRPETPDTELSLRNVLHTDEEHARADKALEARLLAERRKTPEQIAAEIARLVTLDASMEPLSFERIAREEAAPANNNGHVDNNGSGMLPQ